MQSNIPPPFPFQVTGGHYLAARGRVGLHDEMGLGKSRQLVMAANEINAKRGIVIGPAKLRRNWHKEFRKWSNVQYKITEGRTIHDFLAWERGRFHILLTSYEQATKWAQSIYNTGEFIDFVGFDEGHYLKNGEANRTKAILGPTYDGTGGLINWAEHVWHLSGTPMANDPIDIYTFLRMAGATTLPIGKFVKKYFYSNPSAYGSRQTSRPEAETELKALIDAFRIRRTLPEVGIQLPPLMLDMLEVDGDTRYIVDLLKEYPGLDVAIVRAVREGGLSFLDAQHVMTLRRLLAEAKAPAYAHILYEELKINGYQKRIVMGFHVAALEFIYKFLSARNIPAVLVNGTISDAQAQARIDMFQDDPNCIVFLGNFTSAGIGTTLHASSWTDMLESWWGPEKNAQAIKRMHRIGQTQPCRARFIALANTFDIAVNQLVADKVEAIAPFDGRMTAMAT
jgi:SWI/SNF-related matrix-associated actin-dependent regulator 1 of chromatin subfamily A